jgi:Rod binding domain-containing protein
MRSAPILNALKNPMAATPAPKLTAAQLKNLDQVTKAAKDFEGMFMGEMLKPMFDGIKTGGMFGGGHGEDMFRGLLIDQYGKKIADAGGIGLASSIREAMLKMQEQAHQGQAQNGT